MINYSHPVFVSLRRVGQKLGILRPVVRMFRKLFNLSYENGFDREMMVLISQDDVVWDIGANVGYFTKKFSDKVGKNGVVYGFEPSENTFSTLTANCSDIENIICKNIGLSNKSGSFSFRNSGLENDPTNGLVEDGTPGAVNVIVFTGDELIANKSIQIPNAIKVDVEGFELDVIQGMRNVLKNPALKKIFVEVHFLEMNKRGLKNGAQEITEIIHQSGFLVKWVDPSHFIAIRKE